MHTTNTFRTQPRRFPATWRALVRRAVALAREGIGDRRSRLAGSIAPLEDCYRPDLSPAEPRPEHHRLAEALADAGVDLLLVETFPHVGEALIAVEEAVATGLPTWVSFTAGPDADLLSLEAIREGARRAVDLGAEAVLVNCIPTQRVPGFLGALRDADVPFGAYANAGAADDLVGFTCHPIGTADYADAAVAWVGSGASIVGGCCGTGVAHVRELARRFELEDRGV